MTAVQEGKPSLLLALPDPMWSRIHAELSFDDLKHLSQNLSQKTRNCSIAQLKNGNPPPALERNVPAFRRVAIWIQRISSEEKERLFDRAARDQKWDIVQLIFENAVSREEREFVSMLFDRLSVPKCELVRLMFDRAVSTQKWKIVDLLLKKDVQFWTPDQAGRALALMCKNVQIVQTLLEERRDIPVVFAEWALSEAARKAQKECLALLLEHRKDISTYRAGLALKEAAQENPSVFVDQHLRESVKENHSACVQLLLQRTDISAEDAGSALKFSIHFCNGESAQLILQERADISDIHLEHALVSAVRNGLGGIIELLFERLERNLPLESMQVLVEQLIEEAIINQRTGCLLFLLQEGVDKLEYERCLELLRRPGNEISDEEAQVLLMDACAVNQTECVKLLLSTMSAESVGKALCLIVRQGPAYVGFILQERRDIPAKLVGKALYEALMHNPACVTCILRERGDIPPELVGKALGLSRSFQNSVCVQKLMSYSQEAPLQEAKSPRRTADLLLERTKTESQPFLAEKDHDLLKPKRTCASLSCKFL